MAQRSLGGIAHNLMYEEFARRLREVINRENLWEQYLAPERELGSLFNVSRETVRRGLELLEHQGLISRQRGRGTLVLPRARKHSKAKRGRVIVVTNKADSEGTELGPLMTGLAANAGDAGWLVSFSNLALPAIRQRFFKELGSGAIDGLLLSSFADRSLIREILRIWPGPIVLADHYFEDLPITGVIDDSEGGARQAVEHLLSLGHRRIGYVEVKRRELNPWRYAGYVGALRDAGIEIDEALIAPTSCDVEEGRKAGEALLAVANPPTAILTSDAAQAWGVWRAAELLELTVGQDLALVGFSNDPIRPGLPGELSSVSFKANQIGQLAAQKLNELIEGRGNPGELVKVPGELTIRMSSMNATAGNTAKRRSKEAK